MLNQKLTLMRKMKKTRRRKTTTHLMVMKTSGKVRCANYMGMSALSTFALTHFFDPIITAKKKKVVRRPMAKKAATAVPKRKRAKATGAKPEKREKKEREPKFDVSMYLPKRETRTGNMQIERKMYADHNSDSDDFDTEEDDDDDDDMQKKKRKNAVAKKVRKISPVIFHE
jgi:hypothetical protein